jgi:hypothetical protein
MVPAMEPRAFYIADDERLIPTAYARGPWDPRLQHGGPPSAAIARACARRLDDPAWSLSRISYDLQRPILLAPMSITLEEGLSTRATRRLIAHLTIDGREVIRAHALFVRREALTLPPLPPPAATLPPPEQCEALLVPFASGPVGFAHALELRRARGEYGRGPLAACTLALMDAPTIRAPRGAELTCKGWPQEAALRMLMNNLDPEVAEDPRNLVVYGGTGKAARSWEDFRRIVASLRDLGDDETLIVQSGRAQGIFKTHEDAPRVVIANSLLVPQVGHPRRAPAPLALGLTMYGQMTAGSWIYIGTQGILQGTYETFAACARQHFGGELAGRWIVTGGLGGMGGAQPLAATMNGAAILCVEVDPHRIDRRIETGYLMRKTDDFDEALAWIAAARAARAAQRRPLGNCAEVLPELVRRGEHPDIVTDQTSAHDELTATSPTASPSPGPRPARARPAGLHRAQRRTPWASTSPRCERCSARRHRLRLWQQHPRPGGEGRRRRRLRDQGLHPALHPPALLLGQGPLPLGRALGRPAKDIHAPTARSSSCSPTKARCAAGSSSRSATSSSRASRAGSAGSATASATAPACFSTSWSAAARSRRRSSSAATTSTAAPSPRPTARPRP